MQQGEGALSWGKKLPRTKVFKQILRSRACRALAQDDSAAPQLNRVVRQSHQPVPESSASMVAVRPTTHPQPMVNWGTRATIPKPTNVAVAPPTRIQSSDERRPGDAPALSPASAARTYAGSTAYRVASRAAASCQRRCSAPVVEASAIASAPSAIKSDPPITWPYVVAAPPRSSPNTSSPHT